MHHHDDTKTPAERRRVRVKPWWLIAAAGCLLVGLTLSLMSVDPMAYHWWQYERLRSRISMRDNPTILDTVEVALFGNQWSRYREHLQALVDGGEVEMLSIDLSERLNTQAEHDALCRILLDAGHRGKLVDFAVPSGSGKPGQTLTCRLWCRPEHAEDWRAFFDEYDTSPNAAIPRNNKDAE